MKTVISTSDPTLNEQVRMLEEKYEIVEVIVKADNALVTYYKPKR